MTELNFLIGRGEVLSAKVPFPKGGSKPTEIYPFPMAYERLLQRFETTASLLTQIDERYTPDGVVVAKVTMHPKFTARSYFPHALFDHLELTPIGSKPTAIAPSIPGNGFNLGEQCETVSILVAAQKATINTSISKLRSINEDSKAGIDLCRIEDICDFNATDKVAGDLDAARNPGVFEIGIHSISDSLTRSMREHFESFIKALGGSVNQDLVFSGKGVTFYSVKGTPDLAREVAKYTTSRVVRQMPRLRDIPVYRRAREVLVSCEIKPQPPISMEPRVAILDGGLPQGIIASNWVDNNYTFEDNKNPNADDLSHGQWVSSAFCFGPLKPGGSAPRPYSNFDHFRVLEDDDRIDGEELYRVLNRIDSVLGSRSYDFINLSLGPDIPISDTDIHAWTSVIDDRLGDGTMFMTIAAGNNGAMDSSTGLNRIQVPSDVVNGVAIGAADKSSREWNRAGYSAVGPGRSPGFVKPDLVAFGGSGAEYFHAVGMGSDSNLEPLTGTSFAAPLVLRSAVGIRAIMGNTLSALAIKALLIHSAQRDGKDFREVGWGRIPNDINDIVVSPPGIARIVYQGSLTPSKTIRASIPLPTGPLQGMVKISATMCIACKIDPSTPSSYTKSGLTIRFRPKVAKERSPARGLTPHDALSIDSAADRSSSFFSQTDFDPERVLRRDSGKWETTMHNTVNMRGSSLENPVFDIHYHAREQGGLWKNPDNITYGLIVTIEAKRHKTLFSDILAANEVLTQIRPQITIPLQV